jgi:hypothetical protein
VHILGLIVGLFLMLISGAVLKKIITVRANGHRLLRANGINDRIPWQLGAIAVVVMYAIGLVLGLLLIVWGFRGMEKSRCLWWLLLWQSFPGLTRLLAPDATNLANQPFNLLMEQDDILGRAARNGHDPSFVSNQ